VANIAGLTDPGGKVGTASAARWLFVTFASAPALAIIVASWEMRLRRGSDRSSGRPG
jgi:hypothetical protein